jgi:hypothetical protein
MTEIALRGGGGTVAVAEPRTAAVASLADWAVELDAAYAIATRLCVTPFAPKHFQGKPADAAAAILTGHELGLSPMASLRSIFMIAGTPGMYAKVMVAVVMAQGHEIWPEHQDDERVVVCGRRKGSDHVYRTTWDRARVVKAKLVGNAKYQENPQQMMYARGSAEICRQVAPDALHGIPYSVEELEDMPDALRVEANVAPRVTREEILGPVQEPADDGRMTKEQSDRQFELLTLRGYTSKQDALDYIASVVGRPVAARAELTVAEAEETIAALEGLGEAEPQLPEATDANPE